MAADSKWGACHPEEHPIAVENIPEDGMHYLLFRDQQKDSPASSASHEAALPIAKARNSNKATPPSRLTTEALAQHNIQQGALCQSMRIESFVQNVPPYLMINLDAAHSNPTIGHHESLKIYHKIQSYFLENVLPAELDKSRSLENEIRSQNHLLHDVAAKIHSDADDLLGLGRQFDDQSQEKERKKSSNFDIDFDFDQDS